MFSSGCYAEAGKGIPPAKTVKIYEVSSSTAPLTTDEAATQLEKETADAIAEVTILEDNRITSRQNDRILFTFVVAGDNRPGDDMQPQPRVFIDLLEFMQAVNPVCFINTGDIINGGTDDEQVIIREFSDYLDALEVLEFINFVAPGNHDIANNVSRKYFTEMIFTPGLERAIEDGIEIFQRKEGNADNDLYFYFRIYDVYIIVLDAYEPGQWGAIKNEQLSWLSEILASLKDEDVFVFIHPPPYSYINPDCITDGSRHVAFSSRDNQDYMRNLFEEYMVDAVFSGHDHMYNRQTHGETEYIISGCSGAHPYVSEEEGGFHHFLKIEVKKESWILNVIDSEGGLYVKEEILFNQEL